nr:chloride channel K isoform X4 [Doryrhamphus excisus]XP_057941036.1 chloride channel K isoform X4 [Doryrhamphus excisus]XP_057941037.1 chloride channel K isoform X4 [Doryrhamphus excisus]XP_057941038.1 chloride channel K isoform X4 [Doryrhamphus excisus]
MKLLDETSGRETDSSTHKQRGNQSETFHNMTRLPADPWKPNRHCRLFAKGCLLKLRCCLERVCGMEWYGYAALGLLTAIISFVMDLSVTKLLTVHQWLYTKLEDNNLLQFLCWTLYPACLCALSSSLCHNICPFSTGSGIPEVRTMLAGIQMPNYLSLTNMFTKFLGLICTLAAGSTVFLGKVGPFVHLSTMMGNYLSNLCSLVQATKEKKANGDMLVVAAAVGVTSCFGAPISGVLFSLEVMASHFSTVNYLPCFFSAACGALTFRLFSVWSGDEETLQVLFKIHFPSAVPFLPLEILLFSLLGLLCGAVGCLYLSLHRCMLQFTTKNTGFLKILKREKGLYSALVTFFLASLTFPHSVGQYMASKLTMKQLLTSLIDGRQWMSQSHNASVQLDPEALLEWGSSGCPVYLSLAVFLLMKMWMMVLACTLPLPAGYFMPLFIYGAAIGRLLAEGLVYMSSTTITSGHNWSSINPGGYALAGAAAFSGAVTHTISPALLAVELTGQFSHVVPALLATVLANAVARSGSRPSFYDAVSISKRLPHLPSLMLAHPRLPSMHVGHLLGVNTVQLQRAANPQEVQHVVNTSTERQIPVVESHESPILLGFVVRSELLMFLRHCRTTKSVDQHLEDVCSIHSAPALLSPHNTIQEAYTILSLVRAQSVFVTDGGRLLGVITWPGMKRILEDLAQEI